ncbi:MAG: hypothetical protein E6J34_08990 [Chloroflexi bacterium]|nr:MAG: hypothetical protein E6J34_08990 [Chloroflexota bacterium]
MNSKATYRQQYTRCGKQRCRKCREGTGHGPYWYAYWSENGRTISKYIGIQLPPALEKDQQAEGTDREADQTSLTTPAPSLSLRIYLLGQFRMERKNGLEWITLDSRTWHRRRARTLLACLLSSPGRRLGREQVMALLWPGLNIEVSANRLNGAVHELRQILEPDIERPAASHMLRLERDTLELANSSHIWVDAEIFEQLFKEANTASDPTQKEQLLLEAADLYKGHYLLEELYSEWAAPRRDALQQAWIDLLLDLAQLRAKQKAYTDAIEILDRLRSADPTNETALQRLMILLTQLDRRVEALQMYRHHVSLLEREYEGEPLPETTVLYEKLRKGHIPALQTTSRKDLNAQAALSSTLPSLNDTQYAQSQAAFTFSRPTFQRKRHNQSPLIGRDDELESMRHVLQEIEGGSATKSRDTVNRRPRQTPASALRAKRPHLILLQGEPGIGKTRLAEELSLDAYTRGWAVAWSRSYEQEGTMIPYHTWTDLLRILLYDKTAFSELLGGMFASVPASSHFKLEHLSVLLPDQAAGSSSFTDSKPSHPYEQERIHLWDAILELLGILSRTHPLLLVLDDIHWTDESSIELLTYLAHHLQDERVMLIATCRDGELPPQHKLHALVADLRRQAAMVSISLQPLTSAQIGTLVSFLPEPITHSIQSQAAGNPFFAEELARYVDTRHADKSSFPSHLTPSRSSRTTSLPKTERNSLHAQRSLPESIEAVLERRLNRLSRECQVLLGKASVLGGSFELSQLLPMAGELDEELVLDLLEEALHAGLLTEEGTAAYISYRFWHPLIISHLYEHLSAARRVSLHRKAAEAIKATQTPASQEQAAAAIVYHLSRGGGDPAQIAYYAELAGMHAHRIAAYSEAQRYYLQAIQTLVNHEPYILEGIDTLTQLQHVISSMRGQYTLPDPLHIHRLLGYVAECSMAIGNTEEATYLHEFLANYPL